MSETWLEVLLLDIQIQEKSYDGNESDEDCHFGEIAGDNVCSKEHCVVMSFVFFGDL